MIADDLLCCSPLVLSRRSVFFFLIIRPPPRPPLFPYTTLFRSRCGREEAGAVLQRCDRWPAPPPPRADRARRAEPHSDLARAGLAWDRVRSDVPAVRHPPDQIGRAHV